MKYNFRHLYSETGNASIEYAILFPLSIIFMLGVIEFGTYFIKSEIISNAVSTVTQTLERNPSYYSNLNATQLTALEKSYGSGFIDFTKAGNYLCVQAFATATAAATAGQCTSTNLLTTSPNPTGEPYYISVQASLANSSSITPLGNFIPSIKMIQTAQSSGSLQIGSSSAPPTCTQSGYFLQYDSSQTPPWQCVPYLGSQAGNCNQPWQRLTYSNNQYGCINVPYVFAGGVANATSPNGTGFWTGTTAPNYPDGSFTSWIATVAKQYGESSMAGMYYLPYTTLCTPISFTVPANLPAGQVIAEGNLVYPTSTGDGDWHGWVVSLTNLNIGTGPPTTAAYAGSAYICLASGGNYASFYPETPPTLTPPFISGEHESWTITFIPN